jgi:hypothetical protein
LSRKPESWSAQRSGGGPAQESSGPKTATGFKKQITFGGAIHHRATLGTAAWAKFTLPAIRVARSHSGN